MKPEEGEIESLRLNVKLGGKFYFYAGNTLYKIINMREPVSWILSRHYNALECFYDLHSGRIRSKELATIPVESVDQTFSAEEVITKTLSQWVA